jgi:hypothetical protein
MRNVLVALGLGALIAGSIALFAAIVLLILLVAPALVALAWNVLDFGEAIGAGSLGFWGCVLLGWFLASPFPIRLLIVFLVFVFDPDWFHKAGVLHWPEPTVKNFVAITILLIVMSFSHWHGQRERRRVEISSSTASPY